MAGAPGHGGAQSVAVHRGGGHHLMTPYRSYYYGRNMLMMVRKRMSGLRFATGFLGQTMILLPTTSF